jgi:hypothetical protein
MVEARVRGFSIATKCATVEDFVEKFRDRVDAESILVNTVESREIGTECSFAILLADKKVALAGTCIVREVYTDANNPFMRPGMQLAIKRLGPESQKVFAKLIAKRIAPRRMTQSIPIARASTQSIPPVLVMPRNAKNKTAIPDAVVRRATQPMRGLRSEASPALAIVPDLPRSMPALQIPPIVEEEPLARAPRATPFHLELLPSPEQEPETNPEVKPPPRVEERTPGSPIVLPANPFSDLTDASLEGFVDCRLFEAKGALVEPVKIPELPREGVVRKILDATSEPTPLPPAPTPPIAEPARSTPLPYAATKLPDLPVPNANDRVSQPLITRRMRNRILMIVALVPLLGAAVVVGFMNLTTSPVPTVAALAPPTLASVDVHTSATAAMEPAPPIPPARIHAVLIKTYPIAAKVTVGKRSFGTTPTYIKIPANTPVTVHMERDGFKPVTYPLTSRRAGDRVFVRLERRGGR